MNKKNFPYWSNSYEPIGKGIHLVLKSRELNVYFAFKIKRRLCL